jgi:hypothetical protein
VLNIQAGSSPGTMLEIDWSLAYEMLNEDPFSESWLKSSVFHVQY